MAVYVRVLIPAKTAENTQTTQYTSSAVTTIVDKFTATNYSASAATLSVNIVTALDNAGNANLIVKTVSIQPGQTYLFPEVVGQVLVSGGFISTIASASSAINIRASGRTIS
jgi:mannose-6-phosphate isomerase class I